MAIRNTFSTTLTDIGRNNTVYVESLDIFPTPIAKVVTLQDIDLTDFIHFIITKPLNVEDNSLKVPDDGTVLLSTTNVTANFLTTEVTGTTPAFTGNITRLAIIQLNTLATNGGHFFDISNGTNPGFVFLDQATAQGFDSIGTIEGCSFSTENVGWILCDDGITLNDMLFIVMREQSFAAQKGDHIKLTGTLIGATFDSIIATPDAGDAIFNIASDIDISTQILIHDNLFDDAAGGDLFDPAGLDQTDPKVIAHNNGNYIDSYWQASYGFNDNTEVTFIDDPDVDVPIAGTFADNESERFTLDIGTGELTYIGEEAIKISLKAVMSVSKELQPFNLVKVSLSVNKEIILLSTMPLSINKNVNQATIYTEIILNKGDTIQKPVIRNVNHTNNPLVSDCNILINKN